jgi:predicted nucleotidyltransferase
VSLEDQLDEGRHALEVTLEELREARRRRQLLIDALLDVFPDARHYLNGSVAHGDANTPLTDVDLGVVIDVDGYGPDGLGPLPLMEQARDAIKEHLKDEFPKLVVTVDGKKRAILVQFADPVTHGEKDFTADVIVALDHPSGEGLWIPNTRIPDGWDRAHPERHTELVLAANASTGNVYARSIRLLKHWRKRHDNPLCSWNIKALGLGCIADEPQPLLDSLQVFFTHAATEITAGLTADPAGVAGKIKLPKGMTCDTAASRLRLARDKVSEAIEHEANDRPALAQHVLHSVLPGVITDSDIASQMAEQASLIKGASVAGLWTPKATTPARAWSPE